MLLSLSEFTRQAIKISRATSGHIGIDWETTGLSPYKFDRAVILGFTDTQGNAFSVDVQEGIAEPLKFLVSNPCLKYCAHSIKFEMAFLKQQFGLEIAGILWDSEVMARLEYNNHMSYSLQNCALRIGHTKYPPMLEWLKKKGHKGKHAEAPAEILEPYVEKDAWLSWELARRQIILFRHWDVSSHVPIHPVVKIEAEMVRPLFEMERYGLLIDVNYCRRALEYEQERIRRAKEAFEHEARVPFVDSRKTLAPLFDQRGIRYSRTVLGNPSFTEESLQGQKSHPLIRHLMDYRTAKKRASAYWENFLELEHNGVIHPSINQNRAATGRMSISSPSAQNWSTDEDDPEFPIRRAFVARENCFIVSLDYSAMELRMICDEANDRAMIEAILSGTDFHQQTADAAGVSRSLAKNGRFAKLYGAGIPKVAKTLGVEESLARTICEAIDASSPRVAAYCRELIVYAGRSPFGYDFLGRRFYYDPGHSYKNPNYRIQGGCGEVLRVGTLSCERILRTKRISEETQMLIPVHDELVFNLHNSDLYIIPALKQAMIDAYQPTNGLYMDVNVHIGKNFHDLEDYETFTQRSEISKACSNGSQETPRMLCP